MRVGRLDTWQQACLHVGGVNKLDEHGLSTEVVSPSNNIVNAQLEVVSCDSGSHSVAYHRLMIRFEALQTPHRILSQR